MVRKSVGYFEGTDPAVLTSLICEGCDTIPISNGFDNYGQHVRLFNEESKVDLLISYLHKIIAPQGAETQAEDVLHICDVYQIPLLIVVPDGLHEMRATETRALARYRAVRGSGPASGRGTQDPARWIITDVCPLTPCMAVTLATLHAD